MPDPTKQRPGDQPLPTAGRECVQDALIAQIEQRKQLGIERYGRPLETHNGRNAVQDALEEAIDLAVYLKQVELEMRDLRAERDFWGQAATKNGELYSAAENQRDAAREELVRYRQQLKAAEDELAEWRQRAAARPTETCQLAEANPSAEVTT